MIEITRCRFSVLSAQSNFQQLIAEYSAESQLAGLPPAGEKLEAYKQLENNPAYHSLGAFFNGELVGFVSVLTPVLPHYGVMVAVAESLFVTQVYRHTGAGLALIAAAEALAAELKAPGILFSAPTKGSLEKVLPRRGYRQTNAVFFKELAHG